MDLKGLPISNGKSTPEEAVAINVIDSVERGADAVIRGTVSAVIPVASQVYEKMAPNADLWGAGFHALRSAAGLHYDAVAQSSRRRLHARELDRCGCPQSQSH